MLVTCADGPLAPHRTGWPGIEVVATDLAESFRAGLSPHLDHARRVADPFHVVRVGRRCLDSVRRRVQNDTLDTGAARKIRCTGSARSSSPAPNASTSEAPTGSSSASGLVIPATRSSALGWPVNGQESVREVYLTDDPAEAAVLLDKAIAGCAADDVAEIQTLGKTLKRWRTRSSLTITPAPPTDRPRASTCA